jgi:hypothetical protein
MTHVQPYPIDDEGHAGLQPSFESEQPARAAIVTYCRAKGWGWFHVDQRGEKLWEAYWPMRDIEYQFIVEKG